MCVFAIEVIFPGAKESSLKRLHFFPFMNGTLSTWRHLAKVMFFTEVLLKDICYYTSAHLIVKNPKSPRFGAALYVHGDSYLEFHPAFSAPF